MFNRFKARRERELMEKIAMIKPSSRYELKQQCLMLSNLDIDKAEKMYDFMVKDMNDIPEVPPTQKTFMENFGEQANGVFAWFRENQDMIGQGFDFIRGIIASRKGGAPVPPPTPLPPING